MHFLRAGTGERAELGELLGIPQHKQMLRLLLVILVRTQVPKCNQGKMKRDVANNRKNKYSGSILQV